jgi:precorrin-6B methylase 2
VLALLLSGCVNAWLGTDAILFYRPQPALAENVKEEEESEGLDPPYEFRAKHSRNGIGKFYMGREIAKTTGPDTADWQERPTREGEQRPDLLVANLGLEPDDVVADVGAGTGYHTFRISPLVSNGKVLAVEIDQKWINLIEAKARAEKVTNVATILGTATDPRLPPESVDLVLMVDVYHELSHPIEMMEAILKALKPDGRVVLVEYRAEDPEVPVMKIHKMSQAQVKREMNAAGLVWRETKDLLPRQHLMFFERP